MLRKRLLLHPCYFSVLLALFLAPVFAHAQTAQRIERLLSQEAVTYEDAAFLVLEASDTTVNSGALPASAGEAFNFAREQGWLPAGAAGNARLDGVCLLIMRSFDIKGGIFYTLTKNPRYAYRELVYRNIIQGLSDPQMAVSGDLLLFLVNRVLSFEEAGQL